eukprot:CAMPEP_0177446490 /NCGR_PEP_ID=MMETSP0369-20130122/7107_1 /TAXON_ID=447022 ORGANISM="Scrippsiella hangoei-like, Strain SHHI-4" /NCGR_SAMPLE_ID=MMETSP0369 /ASSEMBLY_ACC=CAM_ASM_000364 /LENGTH=134 /DNA_ID=CAMNT_0018918709 /DNA_START=76 /DNA_END=481 /DNA_ORIENTATION=-
MAIADGCNPEAVARRALLSRLKSKDPNDSLRGHVGGMHLAADQEDCGHDSHFVAHKTERRERLYQLFGFDLTVSEDRQRPKVWLLEVHAAPACAHSSPGSCAQTNKLMDDLAKVMVDREERPHADIGEWEPLTI